MNLRERIEQETAAYETGTPFLPLNTNSRLVPSRIRVMPSPYAFPTLPMACTFIRSLNVHSDAE